MSSWTEKMLTPPPFEHAARRKKNMAPPPRVLPFGVGKRADRRQRRSARRTRSAGDEQTDDAPAMRPERLEELEHPAVVARFFACERQAHEAREMEVARGDCVGVAERPAEHGERRPGADARNRHEALRRGDERH